MEIPKSFYSFVTEPNTQKIRHVNCDLCRERIFSVTLLSRRYDDAIAAHLREKHGDFVKALSLEGLLVPESWLK